MARIGIELPERKRPQPLEIDFLLEVDLPSTDLISRAVDYRQLQELAEKLALEHISLIETFALRLARACVSHPLVLSAEITVSKPEALARGLAATRVKLIKGESNFPGAAELRSVEN